MKKLRLRPGSRVVLLAVGVLSLVMLLAACGGKY